jgi:hypothetical protein
MVENFSWVTDKQDNFKEYVLNLPDDKVEEILGSIPSGWNYPPKSHREFVEEVPKVNFTNSFGLGVASNNVDLIEEIKQTFKL